MFKKMKALTTVCPLCEAKRIVDYGTNEEVLNVRGEEINILSKVFYCPTGDHFFSHIEEDEEKIQYAYTEYRKRKKLLQPEEIKEIRNKYKLSQEGFSTFLDFGKKTIHRYETGAIPDGPHNSIMKLMQDTSNFILQYEQVKDKLNERLKQKIEKRIQELVRAESQLLFPFNYNSEPESDVYSYLSTTTVLDGAVSPTLEWQSMDSIDMEVYEYLNEFSMNYKKKNNAIEEYSIAA